VSVGIEDAETQTHVGGQAGKVKVDHISNNYVKFMKKCVDTDNDPTSRPPPTSSMEKPSPFHTHTHTHTHLWRWSRRYRNNGVGARVCPTRLLGTAHFPLSHAYLAWLNNRWFYESSETPCVMDFIRNIEN
jgi:hypothetical protein